MQVNVRSRDIQGAEVAWFAPICNGDTDFLGELPDRYKSNWENASNILLTCADVRKLQRIPYFITPQGPL